MSEFQEIEQDSSSTNSGRTRTHINAFFGESAKETQGLPPQIIQIHQTISAKIPDEESLSKSNFFIVKWIGRHRKRFVCLAAMCVIATLLTFAGALVAWLALQFTVRAAGLDAALVNDHMVRDIEAEGRMASLDHALLLVLDPRYQNYTPITPDELSFGELPWTVAANRRRANFTLDVMAQTVRNHAKPNETCLCYAEFGLPYNVVFDVAQDELLYEPKITQEFAERKVKFRYECQLHELVSQALAHTGQTDTSVAAHEEEHSDYRITNSSGIVEYYTRSGKRGRRLLDLPIFPCVKHCLQFFFE